MERKGIKLILTVFSLILLMQLASAEFPIAHHEHNDAVNALNINSNIAIKCRLHPDLCYAGNILTDFSVTEYYTKFIRYVIPHSTSFCISNLRNANTPEEEACAVGSCLQIAQDVMSHNEMVPHCIENIFLPNVLVHPFCEQKLDNWVVENIDPNGGSQVKMDLGRVDICKKLFLRTLEGTEELDDFNKAVAMDKLIAEIKGSKSGYDPSFNNIKAIPGLVLFFYSLAMFFFLAIPIFILVFRIRSKKARTFTNWMTFFVFLGIGIVLLMLFIANIGGQAFATFSFLIKPISELMPIGDAEQRWESGFEHSRQLFTQGEDYLIGMEGSGASRLRQADDSITTLQFSIFLIFFLLMLNLLFVNFRAKQKNKFNVFSIVGFATASILFLFEIVFVVLLVV